MFEHRRMRKEKERDPRVGEIADKAFAAYGRGDVIGVGDHVRELREIGAPACAGWIERHVEAAERKRRENIRRFSRGQDWQW